MYVDPPTPRGQWFWGNLNHFQKDPLGLYLKSHQEQGDIVRFRFGPKYYYFLVHPDDIRYVLSQNCANYCKMSRGFNYLRRVFGEGMLFSEGKTWQQQRKRASPEFGLDKLVRMVPLMSDSTAEMISQWDRTIHFQTGFDIYPEMARLALKIVDKTLLGVGLNKEADIIIDSIYFLGDSIIKRTKRVLNVPLFFPTSQNSRIKKVSKELRAVVNRIVHAYRAGNSDRRGFLTMLISDNSPDVNDARNEKRICDELLTILVSGYQTTAVALTWTWFLIAQHKYVEDMLFEEVNSVLNGRVPQHEDLTKLIYTEQVIKESLRLFPPIWQTARSAVQEDHIGDYKVPANSVVIISPYVTHRHKDFWEEPNVFKPERFAPKNEKNIHPFAFFPFGGGPRKCIAHQMAMNEAKLIIAMVIQKFCVRLATSNAGGINPLFTLFPKDPVRIALSAR